MLRAHCVTTYIKTGVYFCVPFCGGKLSDLTSDEFHCKHLRVVYVTDESKHLKGEKKGGRVYSFHTDPSAFIPAVNLMYFIHNESKASSSIYLHRSATRQNKMLSVNISP